MISPALQRKCSTPLYNPDSEDAVREMAWRRSELKIIVTTGLGSDVDRYVSQSPTLVKQITQLKHDNWKFVWGAENKGSTTQRPSEAQNIKPRIIIASEFRSDKPKSIAQAVSTVAHEVGHAFFYQGIDFSSVEKCIDSYMIGGGSEADAVINQVVVRAEILNAVCIDIFAEAQEENWMKIDIVQVYNDGLRKNDIKRSRREIAKIYYTKKTSNTQETYEEYYGKNCRDNIATLQKK